MIYPDNFENKIQFNEIRSLLKGYCLSQLGKDKVDDMAFTSDAASIQPCRRPASSAVCRKKPTTSRFSSFLTCALR